MPYRIPVHSRGVTLCGTTTRGFALANGGAGGDTAPEQILLDVNALAAGTSYMEVGNMDLSEDDSLCAFTSDSSSEVRYLPAQRPHGRWRLVRKRSANIAYDVDHRGDHF